jgi:hypothetical protein
MQTDTYSIVTNLINVFPSKQLCKHGPTHNNMRLCFYVVRATPSADNGQINSQSDT